MSTSIYLSLIHKATKKNLSKYQNFTITNYDNITENIDEIVHDNFTSKLPQKFFTFNDNYIMQKENKERKEKLLKKYLGFVPQSYSYSYSLSYINNNWEFVNVSVNDEIIQIPYNEWKNIYDDIQTRQYVYPVETIIELESLRYVDEFYDLIQKAKEENKYFIILKDLDKKFFKKMKKIMYSNDFDTTKTKEFWMLLGMIEYSKIDKDVLPVIEIEC